MKLYINFQEYSSLVSTLVDYFDHVDFDMYDISVKWHDSENLIFCLKRIPGIIVICDINYAVYEYINFDEYDSTNIHIKDLFRALNRGNIDYIVPNQ